MNVNDIFNTRTYGYYFETPFFTQTYDRIKDPQVFRLNFSYRLGKKDMSLFKRENNKNTDDTINHDM
jgi:ferric enterobactin receptor